MDELRIVSGFTRGLISKLIRMTLRKKVGCDADIQLHAMDVTVIDGKTHIHLDLDAELEKEELLKLLKNIGLT